MVVAELSARCPTAALVGPALVRDFKFQITRRGYATIVPASRSVVHGLLWRLMPRDEAALDRFESVKERLYQRVFVHIEAPSALPSPVLAYVACDATPGHPRPGYLEAIITAAKEFGFPAEYVRYLSLCRGH